MAMLRWSTGLGGLALALGLAVPGCADSTDADDADVHVMAVLPLSGSFASKGAGHQYAMQMAVDSLEQAGGPMLRGLGGRLRQAKVRLLLVDSQGDKGKTAIAVRQKLEEYPDTVAIVSSTGSAHEGSLPTALERRIPHFEISSGAADDEFINDPALRRNIGYHFASRATCRFLAEMGAEFVFGRFKADGKWKRILQLRGTHAHDIMHLEVFKKVLARLTAAEQALDPSFVGPEVVNLAEEDYLMQYGKSGESEPYRQHIAAQVAKHSPDLIWYHLRGDDHNFTFLANARATGYEGSIVTCGMARKPKLLEPSLLQGLITYLDQRFWFVMRGPVRNPDINPHLETFKTDYQRFTQRLGDAKTADTFAASAYDTMMLIGLAVSKAGSVDRTAVRDAIVSVSKSGETVPYGRTDRALNLLREDIDVDYEGASGSMDIRQDPASPDDRTVPGEYYVESVTYDPAKQLGKYTILDKPSPTVK